MLDELGNIVCSKLSANDSTLQTKEFTVVSCIFIILIANTTDTSRLHKISKEYLKQNRSRICEPRIILDDNNSNSNAHIDADTDIEVTDHHKKNELLPSITLSPRIEESIQPAAPPIRSSSTVGSTRSHWLRRFLPSWTQRPGSVSLQRDLPVPPKSISQTAMKPPSPILPPVVMQSQGRTSKDLAQKESDNNTSDNSLGSNGNKSNSITSYSISTSDHRGGRYVPYQNESDAVKISEPAPQLRQLVEYYVPSTMPTVCYPVNKAFPVPSITNTDGNSNRVCSGHYVIMNGVLVIWNCSSGSQVPNRNQPSNNDLLININNVNNDNNNTNFINCNGQEAMKAVAVKNGKRELCLTLFLFIYINIVF